MPNRKIDRRWEEYIEILVVDNPRMSIPKLKKKAEAFSVGEGLDPLGCPGLRTMHRIKNNVKGWTAEQAEPYLMFRWPESMESGALPWEAGPAAMELLKLFIMGRRIRPTLRRTRLFWAVTRVAPDLPIERNIICDYGRSCLAELLYIEYRSASGLLGPEAGVGREWTLKERVEAYLSYRPWSSRLNQDNYVEAVRTGRIPSMPGE